ncbi:hypothetical protein D3C76_1492980 [compost metagenome]
MDRMKIKPAADPRSPIIIIVRRSNRSASTPPIGRSRIFGRKVNKVINATLVAVFVFSKAYTPREKAVSPIPIMEMS